MFLIGGYVGYISRGPQRNVAFSAVVLSPWSPFGNFKGHNDPYFEEAGLQSYESDSVKCRFSKCRLSAEL